MEDRHGLQTGLKRRHVTMIALGGVIAAIVVVIASMALVNDVRSKLWWSLGSLAVVLGAYVARSRLGDPAPRERSPRFAREEEMARTSAG